jgi:TPR repeat protein
MGQASADRGRRSFLPCFIVYPMSVMRSSVPRIVAGMAGFLAVALVIAKMPLPAWHLRSGSRAAELTLLAAAADGLLVQAWDESPAATASVALPQARGFHSERSDAVRDDPTMSDAAPQSSSRDEEAILAPAQTLPETRAGAQPPLPARQLTNEEIAAFLERGREYIRTADLAAARLLFRRAAEAGDPQAALALGATYDPVTLGEIGLENFYSDVAEARTWYEQARELGSPRAMARLKRLASEAR